MRLVMTALAALAGASCAGDICDAGALSQALSEAAQMAPATVEIGACSIQGRFEVAPGVSLRGQGSAASVLVGDGAAAVTLRPGAAAPTRLEAIAVHSPGAIAVLARGPGGVALSEVAVVVQRGVGIGVEGVSTLSLSNVGLEGPITPALASSLDDAGAHPELTGTHGLVVIGVPAASFTDVNARGFAAVGVLLVTSTVTWDRGGASDTYGVGLGIEGGTTELRDVSLCRVRQGGLSHDAFGAAALDSPRVQSLRLHVCENQQVGYFQGGGRGQHTLVEANDNGLGAFWGQRVRGFELQGRWENNALGGVLLHDAQELVLHDAEVRHTMSAVMFDHQTGMQVMAGDGVQLAGTSSAVQVRDLSLVENERVGLLIDLDGATLTPGVLDRITVTVAQGSGASGVVAQDGNAAPGWDAMVTRAGVTQAEDLAAAGRLPPVGIVGPCNLPRPSVAARAFLAGIP